MYTLIAIGPNEFEVPVLFFNDLTSARKLLNSLKLDGKDGTRTVHPAWPYRNERDPVTKQYGDGWYVDPNGNRKTYAELKRASQKIPCIYYNVDENLSIEVERALLRGYNPGCGGIYGLCLVEVNEGEPIVRWDLD